MPFAPSSTTRAWRIFIGVALLALTVPRMTQRGMFGDGLLYATIAKNEGTGVGGFWGPTFTATSYTRFFEAPPLGIGLEAQAFRLLGTHPAVERLFTLVVFLVTALLIVCLWRRLQPHAYDWWPLLLWLLPSIVTWATVNNMLEPTQTMFTTAAVVAVVRAMQAGSASAATAWSLLGALGLVAGVLTKGPVAFFPLGTPLVWWLTERGRLSRAAAATGVMAGAVAIGAALLFYYSPAREALDAYVNQQMLASLSGQREINDDPLAVFRHLGLGIVMRMAIVGGVVWIAVRGRGPLPVAWRTSAFFFLTALSASLPIAVSPKLSGHYFLPSVPLFALAVGALTCGSIAALVLRPSVWPRRVPLALGALLVAASVFVITTRGSLERRDVSLLTSLDVVGPALPRDATIGACEATSTDWRLQAYVNRYYGVSLDGGNAGVGGWLLQVDEACAVPAGCAPAVAHGSLALYRCR